MRVIIVDGKLTTTATLTSVLMAYDRLTNCETIPEFITPPHPKDFAIHALTIEPPVIKLTQPKSYFPPRKGKRGKLKK